MSNGHGRDQESEETPNVLTSKEKDDCSDNEAATVPSDDIDVVHDEGPSERECPQSPRSHTVIVDLTSPGKASRESHGADRSGSAQYSTGISVNLLESSDEEGADQGVIDLDAYQLNGGSRKRTHRQGLSTCAGVATVGTVVLTSDSETDSDGLFATPVFAPPAKKKVLVVVEEDEPASTSQNICGESSIASSSPSRAVESRSGETSTVLTCPICLDTAEQIKSDGRHLVSTVCGHVFCRECLQGYFKSKKSQCPTCRKRVTAKQYHPLFV